MAYPALLSEVRLGPAVLRNRVVSTAHQTGLVHDHLPTDDLVAYHEARARGGVGAVFIEATATHETGLLTAHTIGGYLPGIVGAYERLGAAVRGNGARLFVQLLHGGREQIADPPLPPAIGPSAVPTPRFHAEPRALTQAEIDDIVAGFATSARLAREGGVDGIEVSMAHGYLAAQFFAPGTNTRDDAYNGDLEARLRFARELLAAVRDAAGDGVAIGVRLAADEITPDGFGPEACAEIAAALCAGSEIDFVSAALGYSGTYRGSTYIVPPPPEPREAIAGPVAHMRAAIPGVPLIGTSRIADLDAAERLVGGGAVDLVGMTRAMIADPDLLAKAAAGAADEVIPCIGCNQGCIGHYHAGLPIACVVNPRTGRERSIPRPSRDGASAGRRVLVAGGGPAGVAAALEAAAAGHDVVLAERSAALGGQFRVAGRAPAHRETWERYARWIAHRLEADGVDVRLSTEVAAGDAEEYDAVVLATGAVPYRPPLPASMPCAVVDAPDAILDPARALRPGPRRRLGRRLGRPRRGGDARRVRPRGDVRVRGARRSARASTSTSATSTSRAWTGCRCASSITRRSWRSAVRRCCGTSSRGGRSRCRTVWEPSCSRRAGCRTTACGRRGRRAGGACGPAMSSGLGAPRRPCWRARSRRGGWRRWRGRRWWCRAREVRAGRRRFEEG